MRITYTGKLEEFPSKPRQKFELKLQKLSKMLERKGEKEAHVILTHERFLKKVEITVHAFDHAIVGVGSDGDLTSAASDAVEKLEKQVLKIRNKWRDTKRHKEKEVEASPSRSPAKSARKPGPARKTSASAPRKRVYRVDHEDGRKPMTAEEAVLEMEPGQDYLTYRDAETGRLAVLFRRPDGHFDLIET